MNESNGFDQLHEGVKRWIWAQKWTELRDIQEQAIEPVLSARCDVIISASTAAGKTEAAFLPACSRLAQTTPRGVGILYVSPLKALINDQHRRLQGLCASLDISVTSWHGDASRSAKDKQKKNPQGIILITPESLEAMLLRQAGWCHRAFADLNYIILDEFHAFLGTERGCQLQSLLRRLEFLLQKTIPRIALSATLGDMEQVAYFLRPHQELPCKIIESTTSHSDIKLQLRGYIDPSQHDEKTPSLFQSISNDLYVLLRGKSHLAFANSRRRTEEIAANLADLCKQANVPNEFFPHHGSLSKEIRESLELRLQEQKFPTTAVCTMTLELGIDIGNVDSIAQITAPYSVSSLRQRLGRSGRREKAAILRMFIPESQLTANSHLLDRLRLETFQCVTMVSLLLKKWYEPPVIGQYHLSTLVQQTLSVIGQYGGVRATQLWSLLCGSGPFTAVNQNLYAQFLRALGDQDLISQTQDGQIILGARGERVIEHYTFYTAFHTPEEYRLEYNGHFLGALPITFPLKNGQLIIFAGKRWKILNVFPEKKLITLRPASSGQAPNFEGQGQIVHDFARQEMLRIYRQKEIPAFLDGTARTSFIEGLECFHTLNLDTTDTIQLGNVLHVLPWLGDRITNTITILLQQTGLLADCFGGVIDIRNASVEAFHRAVGTILATEKPTASDLANTVCDTIIEKHDSLLPKTLRNMGYGAKFFDVEGAWQWLHGISR